MSDVHVLRDVVFATTAGFRPLALDLYLPRGRTALTCIYLHGGGWRVGSRRDGPGPSASWSPSFFEVAARLGIAVASVEYRLSSEAEFPAQLEDVHAAARFLLDRHRGYGLPSEQAVWGSSAGGHLAALHALREAHTPLAPSAAVCWYAPTDLDALSIDVAAVGGHPDRSASSREGRLVGGDLDTRRELVADASPVNHVPPRPPPFLFLHGTADTAVPPRQSRRLAERLRLAGGKAVIDLVPGAKHMFADMHPADMRAAIERSVRFLVDPQGTEGAARRSHRTSASGRTESNR